MKFIYKILHKFFYTIHKITSYFLSVLEKKIGIDERKRTLQKWFFVKGDETLRLHYPELTPDDLVMDLGGYKGQWTSDIFSKYLSNIYVFEPYMPFYESIRQRFQNNKKIKVYPFGLGAQNIQLAIAYAEDGTSFFRPDDNTQKAQIKNIKDFFDENNIQEIALMKINIEGGEYDLLEYMIENNLHIKIKNLQIQFHNKYVENPKERMENIQRALSISHELTWQYTFVWENWRRKDAKL